jgi:hypothetical protein
LEHYSPVNRPVTLTELAIAFDVPRARLERLLGRHQITPACYIGRTRVYGPVQIDRIDALLDNDSPIHPKVEPRKTVLVS